jgi:hypothetical protein
MLFRIYFSIAMIVFSGLGHVMPLSDVPRPFARPTSSEITVSDLQWKAASQIPESLRRSTALRSWVKDVYGHRGHPGLLQLKWIQAIRRTKCWLPVVTVALLGRNFLLVAQDKKGHWRTLTSILGAPIFVEVAPNRAMEFAGFTPNGPVKFVEQIGFLRWKISFSIRDAYARILVGPCFYMRWQRVKPLSVGFKESCKAYVMSPSQWQANDRKGKNRCKA